MSPFNMLAKVGEKVGRNLNQAQVWVAAKSDTASNPRKHHLDQFYEDQENEKNEVYGSIKKARNPGSSGKVFQHIFERRDKREREAGDDDTKEMLSKTKKLRTVRGGGKKTRKKTKSSKLRKTIKKRILKKIKRKSIRRKKPIKKRVNSKNRKVKRKIKNKTKKYKKPKKQKRSRKPKPKPKP